MTCRSLISKMSSSKANCCAIREKGVLSCEVLGSSPPPVCVCVSEREFDVEV